MNTIVCDLTLEELEQFKALLFTHIDEDDLTTEPVPEFIGKLLEAIEEAKLGGGGNWDDFSLR